jgi:hypothetical protein
MNTTGYLKDSPHRFNKQNIIPGEDITMDNVSIPLLLRPNKGKSRIVMPNSGEYKFPGADFVTETPLASYQTGSPECPKGYQWNEFIQQCEPADQSGFDMLSFKTNQPLNPQTSTNIQGIDNSNVTNQNQLQIKRQFGTPNIPAITSANLLGFGLATFANNMEQGRQKAFIMKNMNNPLFNGSYSNAQNDYGVDPYEQTGQLRPTYQQGGRASIQVTNPNDPRLRAYNDSLTLYNATKNMHTDLSNTRDYKQWEGYTSAWNKKYATGDTNFLDSWKRLNNLNHKSPKPNSNSEKVFGENQWGSAIVYKKPVQPVAYQAEPQEPKFKPTINPRFQGKDMSIGASPNIASPNMQVAEYDIKKPTNFVYTNANEKFIDQQNSYFPDERSLRAFAASQNTSSIQSTKKGATATGYIKQQGGVFQTQAQINAANAYAKNFAIKRGLISGEDTFVGKNIGDPIPQFKDINSMSPAQAKRFVVPNNITKDDIQTSDGLAWYTDPSSGSLVDIDMSVLNQPRFNSNIKRMQKGGKFDPIAYLYEDDEKQVVKKEEKQAKKKRITTDDIEQDQSFSDEDVLNMDSPLRGQRTRNNNMSYQPQNSTEYAGADNFAMMYLKHQQGPAGAAAIQKAAEQGLSEVPRNWNKENIQSNMKNNVGKDFKGQVTPAAFINYWAGKVNRHMQKVSKTQTPYDEIFQKIGQEQGVDPLFLKTVANIESGLNPNNNTKSKYKGLFAQNSNTFKGNIFDPVQSTKVAAQNFKRFEAGGEFQVDFDTIKELQAKGIKFKIL